MKDLEWELARAFCNLALRWGIEREQILLEQERVKDRKYREKVKARIRISKAYNELRADRYTDKLR
jgi:hypothetical protein